MRLFTEAAQRCERKALRDQLANLRAAQFEKAEYQKYLKALSDD